MGAIETNNLTKKYGNFLAVDHINMKVPHGKVYGFIGPNGAGKTTTIGMIMGHKKITDGSISVLDEEIKFSDSKYKHHIGFVSDVPEFYNWMSAREYLQFTGELFHMNKTLINERIEELLKLVDLKDTKRSVGNYSRGMRQRLGIAQALINDPSILIMDEPTSALDPIGRKEVMDIILKLKGEKTIFYSTHILNDVERVCDIVGIINEGKLLLEDTITNLKKQFYDTKIIIETNKPFDEMKQIFEKEEWFESIYMNKEDTCLAVSDEDKAMVEIPKIIAREGLKLRKFIKEEQTLEDIFLKVVGK